MEYLTCTVNHIRLLVFSYVSLNNNSCIIFSDAALARCIESSDSPFPHTDPDLLLLKVSLDFHIFIILIQVFPVSFLD